MEQTKIAWADHTFNPWTGCERKSEGCDRCYARQMHERWHGAGSFARREKTSGHNWKQPVKWSHKAELEKRPAKVFVGSMCDWLDLNAPNELRLRLLETVLAPSAWIRWLLLTKRPEFWSSAMLLAMRHARSVGNRTAADAIRRWVDGEAPRNVWFGVTAENQERWIERVNVLRTVPAEVRWVSVEPMLGPVLPRHGDFDKGGVDWVVAGGENGAGARMCRTVWIRDLWHVTTVPFFFKQWGKNSEGEADWLWQVEGTRNFPAL